MALATAAVAAMTFTACQADDDFRAETTGSTPQSRATEDPEGTYTITFEDFDSSMMAVSPAAPNYYSYNGYTQVTEIYDPENYFTSFLNSFYGGSEYYYGGIALSKWCYRSNEAWVADHPGEADTIADDWWYSYNNQASVYNTDSTAGVNCGAGHNGSNNFAVLYGYSDFGNEGWGDKSEFSFNAARKLVGLWYCNSAYTYGVMMNGNRFGEEGVAVSMPNTKGYFQVLLECYDEEGTLLTTKTKLLADYRNGHPQVVPVTTWNYWEINVEGVKSVKINFEGSDVDELYGLNTPAYLCIDDIIIQ